MSREKSPAEGEYQRLTSPGPAAIAIIRARGEAVGPFVRTHLHLLGKDDDKRWSPGRVLRAELLDRDQTAIDNILLSVHEGPPAWDLRIHLHGSPWIVRRCAELLNSCGLTEVVEERTTLWNTTDTIEAEAFALMPRMLTPRGVRWLSRQVNALRAVLNELADAEPDQAARAACRRLVERADIVEWFATPLRVALVGPPNAGKSTLANALADETVSLVSPTPGTTRDWVEVPGEAAGFPVVWLDTAGLREAGDALESVAIDTTRRLMKQADAILVVLDATDDATPARDAFLTAYADIEPTCTALNKSDLIAPRCDPKDFLPPEWRARAVTISAMNQTGFDGLHSHLLAGVGRDPTSLDAPSAFSSRQTEHLKAAMLENDRNRFRGHVLRCLDQPP